MTTSRMTINPNHGLDQCEGLDPTTREMVGLLKKAGKSIFIEKGKSIIREGEIVDFIFFVEKGVFRTFRWVEDEEITLGFSFLGDLDTSWHSYITSSKSRDSVEALTDGRITKIHRHELDCLLSNHPELKNFTQYLLSQHIDAIIQRNIDLRIKSAEIFYKQLLERQPQQVSSVPLMYIASYLGISRERLSRIRRKMHSN